MSRHASPAKGKKSKKCKSPAREELFNNEPVEFELDEHGKPLSGAKL